MRNHLLHIKTSEFVGPVALTFYIALIAVSGFLLGVKGVPWWYQLLIAIASGLAIVGLWLTLLADPGALTPAHERDAIVHQLDAGIPVPDGYIYQRDSPGATWLRRSHNSKPDVWVAKYCPTCRIWRPPRSHHCKECGVCMEHWDHHCAVVGNCIAKKNHRFFAGFLISAQVGCILLLGGAIWHLKMRGVPSPGQWMGTESFLITFLAVVYGYHALVLLFGTGHCLSILLDITTKDLLTDRRLWESPPCCPGARSPINLYKTWRALCCGPLSYRQYCGWYPLSTDDSSAAAAVATGAEAEAAALMSAPAGTGNTADVVAVSAVRSDLV